MRFLPESLSLMMGDRTSFQYVPNRGNAGDALIADATAQVCRKLGLNEDASAKVVMVAGGGGIHPSYTCLAKRLQKLNRSLRVIVLPSTVSAHWGILRSFDNLTLMCRDKVTFGLAGMNGVNATMVHDAAFSWAYDAAYTWDGGAKVSAYRTDGERAGRGIPEGNEDFSTKASGMWTLNGSSEAAKQFVLSASQFGEIETDRLHVAIAAAKLGRKVLLRPGNYFKNKAVFDASLSGFPNVRFEE